MRLLGIFMTKGIVEVIACTADTGALFLSGVYDCVRLYLRENPEGRPKSGRKVSICDIG
jgi:hypothetical protein